jgi:phage shock protein PspC (stress-responsive transcriptional regulator)
MTNTANNQNRNMTRTWSHYIANVIAGLSILLNCFGVCACLATCFNWNLSPEKAVDSDELMDPAPLLIMTGCAFIILVTIIMQMARIRLKPLSKSVRNIIGNLALFGVVFYFVMAICFPRHPLRFNGPNIEMNDGKWVQIQPGEAEKFFRQNIRRNIGSLIFFGNVALSGFVFCLFKKSNDSSDGSSSSDGIFGV